MKKTVLRLTVGILAITFNISAFAQVYTFTNCNATGRFGPTQAQVNTAYTATTLAGAVTVTTQGIQEWTVSATGNYSITGSGASGGNAPGNGQTRIGGLGATMYGEFTLISGDVVAIIAGQTGIDCTPIGTNYMEGGGGGTFVTVNGTIVMAVAGGGGAGLGEGGNFGANGTLMSIYEVDSNNFDNEITLLHQWTSNSPAVDPLLMPFWAASSTPNVFLTAFKIF